MGIERQYCGRHHIHGFSLLEVVFVLVILSILVMIAIPMFSNSTANARTTTDEANVVILNKATQQLKAEQQSDNNMKTDLFASQSSQEAVQYLVNQGYIQAAPMPTQNNASFAWDRDRQTWEIEYPDEQVATAQPPKQEEKTEPVKPEPEPLPEYPEWDPNKVYLGGSYVIHDGRVFMSHHYANASQKPGSIGTPWQEITKEWRNFNIYQTGDTIIQDGKVYTARHYSQNQQPGQTGSPWQENTDQWRSFNIYNGGDTVWHNGVQYRAKWYSQNAAPGSASAWEKVSQ